MHGIGYSILGFDLAEFVDCFGRKSLWEYGAYIRIEFNTGEAVGRKLPYSLCMIETDEGREIQRCAFR